MFKHSLFLVLSFLLYGAVALANSPTNTLFAVDVSLSAGEKDAVFEIIRETIHVVPETHIIGLTLFDDTVRGFVAPAQLDEQQIKALNQIMADAPVSVRSTSNFTVGIERAIDAFESEGSTNLMVFSRGVIDTKSQDPRAQHTKYIKWLDEVLLPQATQSNIAVKLVVNQIQSNDELNPESNGNEIFDLFAKSDQHTMVSLEPGNQIAPELISLLNIPDRDYGEARLSEDAITSSTSTPSTQAAKPEDTLEKITEDISQNTPEDTPEVSSDEQSIAVDTQASSSISVLSIARIVLLAVCLALLVGIVIWRYRARGAAKNLAHSTHSSSSYLPLTQKPSEAMEEYMEKETDLAIKPDSRGSQ